MSSPKIIFLDTGPILSFFNNQEEEIADKTLGYLAKYNTCSRHTVSPCLVELFYKVKKSKRLSPADVSKNFDSLGITPFPTSNDLSQRILNSYFQIDYKNGFDFADFFICCVALQFGNSAIVTIDLNDLPLALTAAYKSGFFPKENVVQIVPVNSTKLI